VKVPEGCSQPQRLDELCGHHDVSGLTLLIACAESALAGGLDNGNRGDRYQVVVHVEAE
jgi:hypothetical protein